MSKAIADKCTDKVVIKALSVLCALLCIVASIATVPMWLQSEKNEYRAMVLYNLTWAFCATLLLLGVVCKKAVLLYCFNLMLILHILLFAVTCTVFLLLAALIPDARFLIYALISVVAATSCGIFSVITSSAQLYLSNLVNSVECGKCSIIFVHV